MGGKKCNPALCKKSAGKKKTNKGGSKTKKKGCKK